MEPTPTLAATHLRQSITNGNPHEQSLIRRWWHEQHNAQGRLVWEFPLARPHSKRLWWADAIWFPDAPGSATEESGLRLPSRFPLAGARITLCEAKHRQITFGLIGQALIYAAVARRAGALVERIVIFAETADPDVHAVAGDLGLEVVVTSASSGEATQNA